MLQVVLLALMQILLLKNVLLALKKVVKPALMPLLAHNVILLRVLLSAEVFAKNYQLVPLLV